MTRIAIIGLFLESNRYSPVIPGNKFRLIKGDAITEDARSEKPKLLKEGLGFFEQMDATGEWEPMPISMVLGGAGGPAEGVFINESIADIESRLTEVAPVDGVYILNHGAMTTTLDEDPDGTLYEAVRSIVGADTPIVTTIDLHANISQRMVDNADVIVSYITDPHIDQFERGKEAADVMRELLSGVQPMVRNIRVPIVPPNVSLLTSNGPYGDLIDFGQSRLNEDILNVSVVAGVAYSDTSENGLHIIVVGRDSAEAAEALCAELAQMAWDIRDRFMWNLVPIETAVKTSVLTGTDITQKPVLLADLGDNIGAGGPGNTLWLLEALYTAQAEGVVIGSFFDSNLVASATGAGEGASFTAKVTGDDWEGANGQLIIENAQVLRLHPGTFPITMGPLNGMIVNAGPMALLQLGTIKVLLTSRRPIVWPDPTLLEELGVPMESLRTLVLKCRSNYRAVYNRYFDTDRMIEVDTPGRTSPVLTRHDWQNLPRPSYPIDRDFDWQVPTF